MPQGKNPGEGTQRGGSQQPAALRAEQLRRQAQENLPEGAVTAAYKANREQVIDLLNRALASEWIAFLQYEHHYTMASDIHNPGIRAMWREHAGQELGHARRINERINQLGGVPANDPRRIQELTPTPFEAGHDLCSMMETDLGGERVAIQFYNDVVRVCAFDDNETRTMMEAILLDENDHASELSNALYQFDASTGKQIVTLHQEPAKGASRQLEAGR